MRNLFKRVSKLELGNHLSANCVLIEYIYQKIDGKPGEEKAKAAAVKKWEEKNGPLGAIKAEFNVRCVEQMTIQQILDAPNCGQLFADRVELGWFEFVDD